MIVPARHTRVRPHRYAFVCQDTFLGVAFANLPLKGCSAQSQTHIKSRFLIRCYVHHSRPHRSHRRLLLQKSVQSCSVSDVVPSPCRSKVIDSLRTWMWRRRWLLSGIPLSAAWNYQITLSEAAHRTERSAEITPPPLIHRGRHYPPDLLPVCSFDSKRIPFLA